MSRRVRSDADGRRTRSRRLTGSRVRSDADGRRTRSRRLVRSRSGTRRGRDRGQSSVVGVAILVAVVVVALGTLTAGIGTVVRNDAATADTAHVAADFDAALAPVETTGVHRGRVSFTEGELRTVNRDLRVLNDSGVVDRVRADALVFTEGGRRVTFLAGAVVRGPPGDARMRAKPPITSSRGTGGTGVLVVGAPALNGSVSFGAAGGGSVLLRTRVTHRRRALGNGTYRVAVETATPDAWRRQFERQNATVSTRDFDDDGVVSVVAAYPGDRIAYVVVHDMRLEVANG